MHGQPRELQRDDVVTDAATLLRLAREQRRIADRAEAELLALALEWAHLHPGFGVITEQDWEELGGERSLPLAGPGTPDVAEFSVAEFALNIGMSSDAGRRYLGDALELFHRLNNCWDRIQDDSLPVWRARRIAAATRALPAEAAAFVDRQVAPVAHKVGLVILDRLVTEALVRFDPEEAEAQAAEAAEIRHADVHLDGVGFDGIAEMTAALDLPDAIDVDDVLAQGAARLAEQGSTDTLAVRRAKALGMLARGELSPDNSPSGGRRIVLLVHTTAEALATEPARQIDVLPVIDLAEHIHTDAYEVPDRLAQQVRLRDVICVYPYCTRPARRCDCDHRVAYQQGGSTCSCNIAPLCRGHHRLKTHSGWTYTKLDETSYLWSSPHGYHYLRDHTGTRDVTRAGRAPTSGCSDPDPPADP